MCGNDSEKSSGSSGSLLLERMSLMTLQRDVEPRELASAKVDMRVSLHDDRLMFSGYRVIGWRRR